MELLDSLVVGGGAAGLSAALVLGRARRSTLVVDARQQSNLSAHGIGGLLGHDGRPPAELYELGRAELDRYPSIEVRTATVTTINRLDDTTAGDPGDGSFEATLDDGTTIRSRTVLLSTGMTYRYPDKDGVAERWGRSVFHCPFCHGWEVRDRPLAALDPTPFGPMRAQLLSSWSDDVTLLTDGPAALSDDDRRTLADRGIAVDERPVTGVRGGKDPDDLRAVRFDDGGERPCGGLLVATTLAQRTDLASQLDLALAPPNPLTDQGLQLDPMGHTSVPGAYAAGDASGAMPSVANSIASGAAAAAGIVHDLTISATRQG